ncbi:hypothetical protein GIB67_031066 [Kingdonia uniflora]|uniref:Reticulon domain-containing protein n=1 Tax=Kingdonia uniflora TaxID=39325 RepID=A0A7J7LMG6_9MAGN|nr:hypothetical protein GIB67_031066 [Kingdonia uniflora]
MDSTPPSNRSESRKPKKSDSTIASTELSLDLTHCTPSNLSKPMPLGELLLLSPSPPPPPKSRTRVLEMAEEEPIDPSPTNSRKRCKSKASPLNLLSCASPRNIRRARRRLEQDVREEREMGIGEEIIVKPRKRRQSNRSRKEKPSLVSSNTSSGLSPKPQEDYESAVDRIGELISDLIMWNDVAKSSLWFGFGTLSFLSSCFTRDIRCSIFSATSQLGLMFLAVSFFYKSFSQSNKDGKKLDYKLNEDDIVAPILLFGAEYGHLLTLWRLCAIGFFCSFTIPKLYSSYTVQINKKVDYLRSTASEAWGACSHKKIVAASATTVFWNLSSLKTRIFSGIFRVLM